jgi:hypothetical protein
LLSSKLTIFGRSVLIAAGAAFELVRARRVPGTVASRSDLSRIEARIDSLGIAVAQLADQWQQFNARLDAAVTRSELSETVDRVFAVIEGEEERSERQTRSVEALRAMVGQTDELLQKVLDGLDAIGSAHDLAQSSR